MPEILVGLVLAGLFAATMSTADSQILSCSAAITNDFVKIKPKYNYLLTKLATILVTILALIIALYGTKNVFNLVLIAWSILASAFAPILTLYCLGQKLSQNLVLSSMVSGVVVALLWSLFGLSNGLYEVAPGIIAGFIPFIFVKLSKS